MGCPDNSARFSATMCDNYMVQRCAAKWDDKCDLFLEQSTAKYDPRNFGLPTFLENVAKQKYCFLDKSDPNARCIEKCEPFNALAGTQSPLVCSVYGTEIYRKSNEMQYLAGDFAATANFRDVNPLKIGKCPVVCQALNKVEKNDIVLNKCLQSGKCRDVLQNLAIYAAENNVTVDNAEFQQLVNNFIITKPTVVLPQISTNVNQPIQYLGKTAFAFPTKFQTVEEVKEEVQQVAEKAVETTGKVVEKVAEKTGEVVVKAVETTGKVAEKVVNKIGDEVQKDTELMKFLKGQGQIEHYLMAAIILGIFGFCLNAKGDKSK